MVMHGIWFFYILELGFVYLLIVIWNVLNDSHRILPYFLMKATKFWYRNINYQCSYLLCKKSRKGLEIVEMFFVF